MLNRALGQPERPSESPHSADPTRPLVEVVLGQCERLLDAQPGTPHTTIIARSRQP
jgi:hypothetical protein